MRTIRITLTITLTEKDNEMDELKDEILSGRYQREFVEGSKNVKKVKATFEELK